MGFSIKQSILLTAGMALILGGCSVQNKISEGYNKISPAKLRQEFKNAVLCECMVQGMNDKELAQRIFTIDKSYYNAVSFALRNKISALLIPVINQIKLDSIASMETVAEGAAGKTVFNHCIEFYHSKKLDSAARAEAKQWYKSNIDSLVHITAPAY